MGNRRRGARGPARGHDALPALRAVVSRGTSSSRKASAQPTPERLDALTGEDLALRSAAARATAKGIAGRSPDAVRAVKRLLNMASDADTAAILLAESKEQAALIGSPNQVEAVRAGVEARAGRFADGGEDGRPLRARSHRQSSST